MPALMQHVAQGRLHFGETLLGTADLVMAAGRRDLTAHILRIGGKVLHAGGELLNGPHDHASQRQIDEGGGDDGNRHGEEQDIA